MTDKTKLPGGVELTSKEIDNAKKDGVIDYIKEGSGRAMAADTGTTGDLEESADRDAKRVPADFQSTFIAPFLDLPVAELERRLTDVKAPDPIADDHARGLLALERSGKNRTSYVKMLCAVIGVKSPTEVTSAGPAYTNDDTAITEL